MIYALIDNGEVARVGLPRTGTLADGRTVSGFHLLPAATLKDLGWLPIDDPGPPDHDPDTQQVVRAYDVLATKVKVVYTVEDLPEPEPGPPPLDEQVAVLQAAVDQLILDALMGGL